MEEEYNILRVKEVLRKQNLDGARCGLLHRVIWCCAFLIGKSFLLAAEYVT